MGDDKRLGRTREGRSSLVLAIALAAVAVACARRSEPAVMQASTEPVGASAALRMQDAPAAASARDTPEPVPQRRVRFREGSKAFLATADTNLELVTLQDRRIVSKLVAGAMRFEISKRPTRLFRVLAGDLSIEASGAIFELQRRGEGAWICVVEGGPVRVAWSRGQRRLGKGEAGLFPSAPVHRRGHRAAGGESSQCAASF